MSSIKAFLSDHETKVDLLNNEAIASTIVGLLRERPDRPVTVGVHGDWGAGKSSILEMIEASVESDPTVLCLKFNGWRFQGFEDAKIALIEGIVVGLLEKRPTLTKATDEVKEVLKRVDWLKIAKKAGGLAVMAMTGLPSPDLVHSAASVALQALQNPEGTIDAVQKAILGLEGVLKPKEESSSVPEEVQEFIKAFDDLLKRAGIAQLIVLIDDLDRCLPDTAIETLEAIRLLVFTPKTAFVVAADEAMIEYSVRKHFPDLPSSSGPQTYARNYLEKLIQIPFRIPPLGEGETRIYVALALAESSLGQDSEEFKKLLEYAREILRRPWLGGVLEDSKVKEALGEGNADAAELIALSDRIGPILARGTIGNPRQVKRFLNAMLLRERMAQARGFGDEVEIPVLAKLMLAERFNPKFFDELVLEAAGNSDGRSELLMQLEEGSAATAPAKARSDTDAASKEASGRNKVTTQSKKVDPAWADDAWVASWLEIEPLLADMDLRPYAFVANQQARMALGTALGPLIPTINALMGGQLAVAGIEADLKKLTSVEAASIMPELVRRVRTANLGTQPAGVEGIKVLVKAHPVLQTDLAAFLRLLPVEELGPWVTAGWAQSLSAQKQEFREILELWAGQNGNRPLALAAKAGLTRES